MPIDRTYLWNYWKNPDAANHPTEYASSGFDRSEKLADTIHKLAGGVQLNILEIGCNAGRNLHYIHQLGYHNLNAIEINENAIREYYRSFPDAYKSTKVVIGPVEDAITNFPDKSVDITFTMAVLEHLHTDSESVFAHMRRITRRWIITIEDEHNKTFKHFPRNYKQIFEGPQMMQIEEGRFEDGSREGLRARVFRFKTREESADSTS